MTYLNACTTPIQRKRLVDPAACGVRLGVELRAAAEREAYQSGMCLSHWIKRVVQDAIRSDGREADRNKNEFKPSPEPKSDSSNSEFDSAFQRDMEKLNDR